MGTGTSIGSSVASVNTQKSNTVNTGRKWGKTKQTGHDKLDQTSTVSLVEKYQSMSCMTCYDYFAIVCVSES